MTNKSSFTSIKMAQHSQETVYGHPCAITGFQKRFTRKKMANYEGNDLFTVETLKAFYFYIDSPLCRMNQTDVVTKLEKQESSVTHSPHY